MASYQQDLSSAYPSRETFGILEGKPAMFKGQGPCDHRHPERAAAVAKPTPSCSSSSRASCSSEETLPCHPSGRSYGSTDKNVVGALAGRKVLPFDSESQGEALMAKWSSDQPRP